MEFILVDEITLCIQRSGSGQPVVFVNSLGSDLRIWDDVAARLTDQFDVVRYDLRGHGLSDAPAAPYSIRDHTNDLNGLLLSLNLNHVILVGISVGGMIAMDFTIQHPDKVKALVVCDSLPKIGTVEMWNQRIDTLRQHGMASLADTILERWFAPAFKDENPAAYRAYYNMLSRMPLEGYTGTCQAIRDADLTDAVRTITCPTLVLCGTHDAATPSELVSGLADLLPASRFVEIQAAGHLPCVENPTATADAILSFLKEI